MPVNRPYNCLGGTKKVDIIASSGIAVQPISQLIPLNALLTRDNNRVIRRDWGKGA